MSARGPEKPIIATRPRIFDFGLAPHPLGDVGVGRAARLEVVDLMLGEKADLEPVRPHHLPAHGREPAADELGEGRLAVAVGAEQADAVVVGQREIDARQNRAARRSRR